MPLGEYDAMLRDNKNIGCASHRFALKCQKFDRGADGMQTGRSGWERAEESQNSIPIWKMPQNQYLFWYYIIY